MRALDVMPHPRADGTGPSAALEALGARRLFRGGAGVQDATIALWPGEIVALVGLNGAGKSTLLRMLLGMLKPTSGVVLLAGTPVLRAPSASWRRVGHLLDVPFAYPELTVGRNLRVSAALRGVADPRAAVDGIIDELALQSYRDVRHRALSSGNRQRVGLAAALLHDPAVIVLDEPANALDPAGVVLLRAALRRRADAGAAALVSSHHLDEVSRLADRILVMNRGRLIGELDPRATELERVFFETVRRDDEERLA